MFPERNVGQKSVHVFLPAQSEPTVKKSELCIVRSLISKRRNIICTCSLETCSRVVDSSGCNIWHLWTFIIYDEWKWRSLKHLQNEVYQATSCLISCTWISLLTSPWNNIMIKISSASISLQPSWKNKEMTVYFLKTKDVLICTFLQ